MRVILLIHLVILTWHLPAWSDETTARRYQDAAYASIWAADAELRTFVLSTEKQNEILVADSQTCERITLEAGMRITQVLAVPDGGWLISAQTEAETQCLLLCDHACHLRDVTPPHLPPWCVPVRYIFREGRFYLLAQGGAEPTSEAAYYLLDTAGNPATCTLLHPREERSVSQLFHNDGSMLAHLKWNADGSKHILHQDAAGTWHEVWHAGVADRLQLIAPAGGDSVYILHDQGQEGTVLAELNLRQGRLHTLSAAGRADVFHPFFSPAGELLGCCSKWEKWHYTALQSCAPVEELQQALPPGAEFIPMQLSADGQRLLALLFPAGGPAQPILYERGRGIRILSGAADVPPTRPTHYAEYPARDGTTIPVYYTLPEGKGPFPTIVFVHGGPRMRTDAHYDWRVQYLVSQGFAVVQPQFRGSRGWGKSFMHAGNRQWGRGCMQTDVQDCLPWLVKQGIARAENIAVFGGSYGGYAATAALCFFPGSFACGISLFGPQDMELYLQRMNAEEAPYAGEDSLLVGHAHTPEGRAALRHISPVYHAEAVTEPLLIYYGEQDTLIPPEHSRRMIAALQAAGKNVTALSLPDEAHGFENPAHEPWLYARHIVPFLKQHLTRHTPSCPQPPENPH